MIYFTSAFHSALIKLGFFDEFRRTLFFAAELDMFSDLHNVVAGLKEAEAHGANGVLFKHHNEDNFSPLVYIFDRSKKEEVEDAEVEAIYEKMKMAAKVPVVCVVTMTEIIVLDLTKPLKKRKGLPIFPDRVQIEDGYHSIFNETFANSIQAGLYPPKKVVKQS